MKCMYYTETVVKRVSLQILVNINILIRFSNENNPMTLKECVKWIAIPFLAYSFNFLVFFNKKNSQVLYCWGVIWWPVHGGFWHQVATVKDQERCEMRLNERKKVANQDITIYTITDRDIYLHAIPLHSFFSFFLFLGWNCPGRNPPGTQTSTKSKRRESHRRVLPGKETPFTWKYISS